MEICGLSKHSGVCASVSSFCRWSAHSLQQPRPPRKQSAIERKTPGVRSMHTDDELGHREGESHYVGMTIGRLWGQTLAMLIHEM